MKVLETGKPWNMESRCTGEGHGGGGCNARLEFDENDLRATKVMGTMRYSFTCPECRQSTAIVPFDKLPERVRLSLDSRFQSSEMQR